MTGAQITINDVIFCIILPLFIINHPNSIIGDFPLLLWVPQLTLSSFIINFDGNY